MKELTEIQKTLIQILKVSGMPKEDAAMLGLILERHGKEKEAVDWMMVHPTTDTEMIESSLLELTRSSVPDMDEG